MINCYEGLPGSGKSYEAVQRILENLKLGRIIYTNIEGLDDPDCREMIKIQTGLNDFQLATQLIYVSDSDITSKYKVAVQGSMLVIDECHEIINSRNWQSTENAEFSKWAARHRKLGYDVLLLTQNIEKIDSHIRGLIQHTYTFAKANYFGRLSGGAYTRKAFLGVPKGKPIKIRVGNYDKLVFSCYKSYSAAEVKELGMQKGINVLMHPIFISLPIIFALAFYLLFYKSSIGTGDLFGIEKLKSASQKALSPSSANAEISISNSPMLIKKSQSGQTGPSSSNLKPSYNPRSSKPMTNLPEVKTDKFPEFQPLQSQPQPLQSQPQPLQSQPQPSQSGDNKRIIFDADTKNCFPIGFIEKQSLHYQVFDCGSHYKYKEKTVVKP
jgi:hypothetical protein